MRIESKADFEGCRQRACSERARRRKELLVCCGTGCLASGAAAVVEALSAELARRGLTAGVGVFVKKSGCHGFCQRGPLVVVRPAGVLYTHVQPGDAVEIVEKSVANDQVVTRLLYRDPADRKKRIARGEDIPFYAHQTRIAMRNIGRADPHDIRDAIACGAYAGLVRALPDCSPDQVIDTIERAGLRGRGGAGFPTGRKWRACRRAAGERKFVVCNGDEGDPGAFKDRSIMEGDPHAVIEGMVIGAWAVGAHEGYVYVRNEYPLAVSTLETALGQARGAGLLGRNILGSGFDFDIRIARGGGAFVCGESSALMRSIEGRTGEPRAKYVHATAKGLFGAPTVLNNVETWADVGAILEHGADWFAGIGTGRSKGTKAFSLVGKVQNTGLIEMPMGVTLRHIVYDVGGGVLDGRPFKAVQTGGPSGGCLPEAMLDLPVDYERLSDAGSMMGSGGMIVMDDRTCMVEVARYFLRFLSEESCGKCTPCREGLQQLLGIYDRLVAGRGTPDDIGRIEAIAGAMKVASLCELGKSAPNPVLSTLRYFRDEYQAHIDRHECPAGTCRDLTAYRISAEACNGCHLCTPACPAAAIAGDRKTPHVIDPEKCVSCGACYEACPMQAVRFFPKREKVVDGAQAAH